MSDLVSEALSSLRAAGAKNVGESSMAGRGGSRWASGRRRSKKPQSEKVHKHSGQNKPATYINDRLEEHPIGEGVWRRPTRVDGRGASLYRDPKKVGDLLGLMVRKYDWNKQMSVGQIMNAWPELVGEQVAAKTKPVHYNEETLELTVQCESTAWASNLRFMQTTMLQSITRKVGPDVVASLKILGPHIQRPNYGKLRVKGRGPRDDFG